MVMDKNKEEEKLKRKLRKKLKTMYIELISKISLGMGNMIALKKYCSNDPAEERKLQLFIDEYKQVLTIALMDYTKICNGKKQTMSQLKSKTRYVETFIGEIDNLSDLEAFIPYFNAIKQWKGEKNEEV